MSEARDQEGFKEDKYQKIIALLSTHQQGREFLEQFVGGVSGLNDNRLSGEMVDQGQNALVKAIERLEQLVNIQEESAAKMRQISQSLSGAVDQLRASEEHGIAVRVLEDVEQQLVSLDEVHLKKLKKSELALEQLKEVEQYFSEIMGNSDENKKTSIKQEVEVSSKQRRPFF